MWIDLAAVLLLLVAVITGAARGALASGLALVAWIAAYVVAVLLAPAFAPEAASAFGVPLLVGSAIAGTLVFFAASLVLGLVRAVLRWAERRRRAGAPRSAADRALGAFFGALRGAVLVLLVGVLGYWLEAYQDLSGAPPSQIAAGSTVAAVSQAAVASAAGAMIDQDSPGGRMAVRIVSDPARSLEAVRGILDDPRIGLLRDDSGFWDAVEQGDPHRATGRVTFQVLADAADLRRRFAQAGFVSADESADPARFRSAMDDALEHVGPRLRALREDPELRSLAHDPEVVHLLENRDTLGLLRNRRFRHLLDRVLAG